MKRYATISMDPPWPERGAGKVKRGADRWYNVIQPKDMPLVIAKSGVFRPAEHSHLYMWVTNNYLLAGVWLMQQLGFEYKTNVGWAKTRSGLGQYFKGKHELILFGVRGQGMHASVYSGRRDLVSWWHPESEEDTYIECPHVLDAGKRVHSAKPPAFYELIEARSKGPYLEMFARDPREGWDVWGDEVAA